MQTTTILRNSLLLCGLAASSCFATTINLLSSASETTNNSGKATVNVSPNPGWGAAFTGSNWVSYTQSGNPNDCNYVQVANGTSVIFSDTFQVAGTPTAGSLKVMADDTTSVTLNGTLLMSIASSVGNTYSTCSSYAVGCTAATSATIDLSKYLKSGSNTLSFNVLQVAGGSFGLDYAGVVTSSATPEPGTLALFGLPLALLGMLRKKLNKA